VRDVLATEPALAAELIEPAAAPLLSPLVTPPRGSSCTTGRRDI